MRDLAAEAAKSEQSFDRVVPLERTLALLPALRARFGITRVADLTYLDRIGMPVFSSVIPRSADLVSVYNGKGTTRDHARIGAVMEAVERQAAGRLSIETFEARPHEIAGALDPRELAVDTAWEGRAIPLVRGIDLVRDAVAYVPRAAVEWPCLGPRIFPVVTTNGLASGNTLLEAIYHALFELVERHVWSLTHARAYVRPHALLAALAGPDAGSLDRAMIDDPVGLAIAVPTGEPLVDDILARITRCDLEVRLLVVCEPELPPVVFATVYEPFAAEPAAHFGIGCSWSPVHATLRALTEAVQSRLADVQGAREDILRADDDRPTRFHGHARRIARVPKGRWHFDGPVTGMVRLADLPDRSTRDLAHDVRLLLDAFRAIGVRRAIVVDISPPGLPVAVVRAIVPDLETMIVDGRTGNRLKLILTS
jgi:ribosomal protein S12 methylthiotransferase accessory factor